MEVGVIQGAARRLCSHACDAVTDAQLKVKHEVIAAVALVNGLPRALLRLQPHPPMLCELAHVQLP